VIRDKFGRRLERPEGVHEGGVTLLGRFVEAVVGGSLLGHLPDAFDWVQLRRVRRQPKQLDTMAVTREPQLPFLVEVVTGTVIDDEKGLATTASANDLLEERKERDAVEHWRELVQKARSLLERHDAKDMRSLAHTEGVYTGLVADSRPRLVERPVEPEARFVAKGNDPAALARFFLIAGKVSRSHVACRARSARASRLRGRWTENLSWCNSLGMW